MFAGKEHTRYMKYFIQSIPFRMVSIERLLVMMFSVNGLELLNKLDSLESKKKEIIEWVYSLQVTSDNHSSKQCGFSGSHFLAINEGICSDFTKAYQTGHLAMTYSALCTLLVLGDDLSRIDSHGLLQGTLTLQQPDGSFSCCLLGGESDMRFVYCASCICYIMNDWSGMDKEKTKSYIRKSLAFDGGFGQGPGLESHGGSTFCAVASLSLMGNVTDVLNNQQIERLKRWCHMRQYEGFQGRPNKAEDTCYSFWVGATLRLLGSLELCDLEMCKQQVLSTQNAVCGGMAKTVGVTADPLHTYLGISGLSIAGTEPSLLPVHPALNMSQRAVDHLHQLHQQWGKKG